MNQHIIAIYLSFFFQVFTSLALFNMLISPLNAFPWVINGLMEAWVSVKRVETFLQLNNLYLTKYYTNSSGENFIGAILVKTVSS